jgi:DNA processing protein
VIAVGGTRSPAVETFCLVSNVVDQLARKETIIISGGVPGVDLAAHMSAIGEPWGSTFAVLANPVELGLKGHEWHNAELDMQILKRGGFISEYSSSCKVFGDEFRERLLARDRIISGLSDLMLVFECNIDSATVDTARRAIVQGKKVVCIDTERKTYRRGIQQLTDEFQLPTFREERMNVVEMASEISKLL